MEKRDYELKYRFEQVKVDIVYLKGERNMKRKKYNPVYEAYRVLLKVFDDVDTNSYVDPADATIAIEEALGYLGEALDD